MQDGGHVGWKISVFISKIQSFDFKFPKFNKHAEWTFSRIRFCCMDIQETRVLRNKRSTTKGYKS